MLQDVEAGRNPEIDGLVGAVIELGQLTATPTPQICAVYALVKLLSRTISDDQVCVRASPPSTFELVQQMVPERPGTVPAETLRASA